MKISEAKIGDTIFGPQGETRLIVDKTRNFVIATKNALDRKSLNIQDLKEWKYEPYKLKQAEKVLEDMKNFSHYKGPITFYADFNVLGWVDKDELIEILQTSLKGEN